MITKKQVEEVRDEMIRSVVDLAREYGVNDVTFRGLGQKPGRTSHTAEAFAEQQGLDLGVHHLALERGMLAFDRMAHLSEHVDENDPMSMAAHIPTMAAYVGGVWMEGLLLGIALGRKYPKEPKA